MHTVQTKQQTLACNPMEATLCRLVPHLSCKKPHFTPHGTNPALRSGRCNWFAASCMHRTGTRACGMPSESAEGGGNDVKPSLHRSAMAKGLVAGAGAAALVCVVGIMCSREALIAHAATRWRFWSSPRSSSVPSDMRFHNRMQLDTRSELERLHELLSIAMERMKEKSNMTDSTRITASLINEWEKIRGTSLDKYEEGLSLIEVLINLRQYVKANEICKKLEGYKIAPETDERLPLRKFIVELSMLLESAKDGKKHDWGQAWKDTKKRWEKFKGDYDKWAKPPPSSSTTTTLPSFPTQLPPFPPSATK